MYSIILFVATIIFSVLGYLSVRLLNNINDTMKEIKVELKLQSDKIENQNVRLSILETEHKINHDY